MSDDVREIVAKELYSRWERLDSENWPDGVVNWRGRSEMEKNHYRAQADAILSALDKAGKVVVERERFERLRDAARHWSVHTENRFDYYGSGERGHGLKPGDLDPLPERGE